MKNKQWIPLESLDQLDQVIETSKEQPIVLFKHSTRCSVSHFVEKNLDRGWSEYGDLCDFYWLDLIQFRAVSNSIAERFEIRHESPQVLVLVNGKIIYHASHQGIHIDDLKEVLKSKC